MKKFHIVLFVCLIVNVLDVFFYARVVSLHGPQYNYWPLSGFYLAFKHH